MPTELQVGDDLFVMVLEIAALKEADVNAQVLQPRHFERLTKAEAARALELSEAAVAQRYFRALKRLKTVLVDMPGGLEEFRP